MNFNNNRTIKKFAFILYLQLFNYFAAADPNVYQQYKFRLEVDPQFLCPSPTYKCANGEQHFLCHTNSCLSFQHIEMTTKLKRIFIAGHNGIRNKVAEDWGIGNMNLVHWSRELETMSTFYLRSCEINNDHCSVIGENLLKVRQNYCLRRRLSQRWPGRVVRAWYLEIGFRVHSIEDYFAQHRYNPTPLYNFSQMIWPSLEFVGCGVAYIQFSFYLIVCYYHPPYAEEEDIEKQFHLGKPCSKCMKTRNVCSLDFLGLCGIGEVKYCAKVLDHLSGKINNYSTTSSKMWNCRDLQNCIDLKCFPLFSFKFIQLLFGHG